MNLATQYTEGLRQKFAQGLKSYALMTQGAPFKIVNANTIAMPRLDVTGFRDRVRGAAIGTPEDYGNDWELKTLAHDRDKLIAADPKDIDESNLARSIANLTNVFNDEQKIPEMDAYNFSKLHSEFLTYGGVVDETVLTEANILEKFDEYMAQIDEDEASSAGRFMYITPKTNKILKNANKLDRAIQVGQSENNVNRNVYVLDDVTIEVVPATRMKTAYDFTIGFKPAAGAKQINMIVLHTNAQVAPLILDEARLDQPTALSSGKYVWFERAYWDLFVLERRVNSIAINAN